MTRTITVAALQVRAHDRGTLAAAWPPILQRIEAAAARGAQLIVLPEATLPAYVLGYERFEEAESQAALDAIRNAAARARAVIVVGSARRESERVYNSALVIDADGSIAGHADKHFLWHFDRQWFAAGERLEPVPTSIGPIGALVCADGRIPTIASTLVDRGAQVLVMPTAWVTSGRDPGNLENVQADLLARVRARENSVAFIGANKCGVELHAVAYCGKSQIVAPDGTLLALASQDREDTLLASIDLRTPHPKRAGAGTPKRVFDYDRAVRIALTHRGPCDGDARLLRILEAQELISAQTVPTISDEQMLDPTYLARSRFEGVDLVVWNSSLEAPWQVTFARARALELRMYVAVIDAARSRAYAVDPDGTVVCGTYDGYEVAGFTYDPARASATMVAPGTDVREGIARASKHATR